MLYENVQSRFMAARISSVNEQKSSASPVNRCEPLKHSPSQRYLCAIIGKRL